MSRVSAAWIAEWERVFDTTWKAKQANLYAQLIEEMLTSPENGR